MIAVIGGGPAGILAAYAASLSGTQVDLYDHNEKLGKKLFITGKGRCNVTNAVEIEQFFDHIVRNNKFLYSSLYTLTNLDLMDLIENEGCKLVTERGNRVFPKSNKSSDIIKAFTKLITKENIHIYLKSHVDKLIIKENTCKGIQVNGIKKDYNAVILCSGGVSYPSTGSDGSGYKIAALAGHHIIKPQPALVGIKTQEDFPKLISGLTLKNVVLKLFRNNQLIFEDLGECLFTHSGISGPIVLSASSFISKPYSEYKIFIDLKPALTTDKLDERIKRDFNKNLNKDFQNSLSELLPKNLIPIIIDYSKIDPKKKVNSITKEERLRLGELLKNFPLSVKDLQPIDSAIVTRGGIDVKEINPNTLESKVVQNLFFAGEVIDVDALTGGYNIQIACSTGYLAGLNASEKDANSN